jgi:CheY-like chemotaxis protein
MLHGAELPRRAQLSRPIALRVLPAAQKGCASRYGWEAGFLQTAWRAHGRTMLLTDPLLVPASPSPFRALVVDDERLLRGLVRRALLRAGFEVTEAAEGHAALTLVRAQPFDLVLSDVEMPVMDGVELLARISGEYPKLPVILLSGSFQLGFEQTPADLGAFELLRKPFSLKVVQEAALRAVAAGGTATPRLPAAEPVADTNGSFGWRRLATRAAGLSQRG